VGKLPVVPYREPEPWVPFGGFSEFRASEEQTQDAELAAHHEAEAEDELRSESAEAPES
jgi:hypothetical protein